jgi:thiamine biosynthesis lipoprotein
MAGLELFSFSFIAMGTSCALHLYARTLQEAELVAQCADLEVRRIESRYSRYKTDSDLSQINLVARAGGSIAVDEETAGLLNYAAAAYTQSGGLFDITSGILRHAWDLKSGQLPGQAALDRLLPCVGWGNVSWEPSLLSFNRPGMELDLGGLGKEYAADRAARVCMDAGVNHGLIDLGGDIRVMGPHPDCRPWEIGIRHPRTPNELLTSAHLSSGALATSGDYERFIEIDAKRYSHILHPKTGWPVEGLCSVSVIADDCLLAGTLCTIAMLKGADGSAWLKHLNVPHVWMDASGFWDQSPGIASKPHHSAAA